ncbi:MAG: site-specific integrase [Clostridia bacterium]|nr:site-specific integrase [Clostridia bacterium]
MAKKNANGDGGIFYSKSQKLWRGQITIGYDENGNQRRKSVSGKNPQEVRQKLKQIEYGIFSGEFVDKSNITIYHLAKQMIVDKYNLNEIKENTYLTHISTLKRLQPIYNTPLQKANETQIRAYLQGRINKSNSILKKDFQLLNATFKEAIKREIITKNPMDHIKQPRSKQKREKVRAFTLDEQNKLLFVLLNVDIKYSRQMLLSMFTGMRMGEVNALTKRDVNLIFNTISVNKTISRGEKGKAVLGDTAKTYAGNRTIIMTEDVRTILSECMEYAEGDMLFTTESGGLVTSNQVNMELSRVLKKYKIVDETVRGKVSCHSLRHTYATRMIEGGMQPKVLQKLLGHTDIRITMDTYCDAFDKFQSENIAAANEYLRQNGLTLQPSKQASDAV